MLRRLARTCHDRRWTVLVAWIVGLVALTLLSANAGGVFEDEFSLPGAESQAASDLLRDGGFDTRAGFQGQLVVAADDVRDPQVADAVTAVLDEIRATVDDVEVHGPYAPGGEHQVSPDGSVAFAELSLANRRDAAYADAVDTITAAVEEADIPGGRLELGGERFIEEPEGGASEGIGLLAAVVILLIAFGSLLAMGLPILTALFGIGTGVAVVGLLANVLTMPSFTLQLVMMLGIGVGIDYALFIVTRYRESLTSGLDPRDAVTVAMDTAGRAVLFAGTSVVVSVMGLFVVGLDVNRSLAVATATGVGLTMLASVTLLPAVLGFVGRNIDRFGLPHRRRDAAAVSHDGVWHRWSRVVQRRPTLPAVTVLAVLVLLTLPTFGMRLGFGDAGNRPESDTTRQAYDLLAEGFGPGVNGPLFLAADVPDDDAMSALADLSGRLGEVDGVAGATPVITNDAGDVALLQVFPTTSPQAPETVDLVHRLRDDVIPAATAGSGLQVHVGGAPAAAIDFADFTADRLPWFIGAVLAVSFLVLMMVFRSVLVPLKAVVMNLLSIGAAYGVIVAVFQWGWGAGLLGVEPGPVEAWAPIMLFAIVFGLSMDYEVFLLSRIREEYDRTGDNASAVADGLASTARVITAAAAIMVVVFGSFVLFPDRALQLFGLGLATAIAVDATVVRLVLVPATMELLGDRNWWLPAWLDRVLPAIHVEGSNEVQVAAAPSPSVAGSPR